MKCLVILPTYNERENLPNIVPEILAQGAHFDVLVVDDNSPDGTGALATRCRRRSAVPSCTAAGNSDWARRTLPALSRRWSAATTSSSRWTPISRTIRPICRACSTRPRGMPTGDRLALGPGRRDAELVLAADVHQPRRLALRPSRARSADRRPDQRLQVLLRPCSAQLNLTASARTATPSRSRSITS